MHMRTTLNIDKDLIEKAAKYTGIREKTALVRAGLQALIEREAARRLLDLGGSMPSIREPKRRKTAS